MYFNRKFCIPKNQSQCDSGYSSTCEIKLNTTCLYKNKITSHQKIKYVGINLNKEVKDLNTENCNTLIKETEDDAKKWKKCDALGFEKLILLKWPYYEKLSNNLM